MAELKDLSLDELLAAEPAMPVEPVDVPEWGGRVYVRRLTVLEREQLDDQLYDADGKLVRAKLRAALVAACLCKADGEPFYAPNDAAAAARFGAKSDVAIRRVYAACERLNGMGAGDAAAGKGDSAGDTAGGSSSASPSPAAGPT